MVTLNGAPALTVVTETNTRGNTNDKVGGPVDVKSAEVAPASVVVTLSENARKMFEEEQAAAEKPLNGGGTEPRPMNDLLNGGGTLPPDLQESVGDKGDFQIVTPMNGGGTLPPDPPKNRP